MPDDVLNYWDGVYRKVAHFGNFTPGITIWVPKLKELLDSHRALASQLKAAADLLDELIAEARETLTRLDAEAENLDNCWNTEEFEEHQQAVGRLQGLDEARRLLEPELTAKSCGL